MLGVHFTEKRDAHAVRNELFLIGRLLHCKLRWPSRNFSSEGRHFSVFDTRLRRFRELVAIELGGGPFLGCWPPKLKKAGGSFWLRVIKNLSEHAL
ncbi:hypothetical protein AVEN_134024-1 [Araneus ventricosus]|uniref:Uncharacterized protein n=1 Tax=Araneus ventricosus TaxID=182803 RepID=A0A4Y2K5B8_ARAVE|nr:hypothetical protein AVEN_134024-1 [Araneus ventricosus]